MDASVCCVSLGGGGLRWIRAMMALHGPEDKAHIKLLAKIKLQYD